MYIYIYIYTQRIGASRREPRAQCPSSRASAWASSGMAGPLFWTRVGGCFMGVVSKYSILLETRWRTALL